MPPPCADEPIHVPGSIQPHGALLAFTLQGALAAWSENVGALLQLATVSGAAFRDLPLNAEVTHAIGECVTDDFDSSPSTLETVVDGQQFDVVVHRQGEYVIAEFECREERSDELTAFALQAHRVNDRLRRQRTATALLQLAVEHVRKVTGFDRVMAYRFRSDDSGEVVAEACAESLSPYLGLRYPASDIPAQARRLYTMNTLRLIPDTHYVPVPLQGNARHTSLDMSHCLLRSVSPTHIEYLQNMGVSASMSISIVVNGRLWGLLACHHLQPRKVPYLIRIACDALAHVIAAAVQSIHAVALAEQAAEAARARTRFLEALWKADDIFTPLTEHAPSLQSALKADAAVVCQGGRMLTYGDISTSAASAIVSSLPRDGGDLVERTQQDEWPESLRHDLGKWVGLLGMCYDTADNGWLLLLRLEQVETIRWGGNPEEHITQGPNGPRLTPRRSFAEWQQTVRIAEPWSRIELGNARQLLGEMHRVGNARYAELDRTRTQLLAMLGHDLRDPLNSISMAASVLQRGDLEQKLGNRILASSGRMRRLISQVLDVSRVQNGLGLGLFRSPVDLTRLIEDIVDETRTANPQTRFDSDLPPALFANIDSDRISQLLSNLLGNAHHHGAPGTPISVSLKSVRERVVIRVCNEGPPIDPVTAAHLFDPFKRPAAPNTRHRTGLGLGLYIANAIVAEHGGTIQYGYESPRVVFSIDLPRQAPSPPDETASMS